MKKAGLLSFAVLAFFIYYNSVSADTFNPTDITPIGRISPIPTGNTTNISGFGFRIDSGDTRARLGACDNPAPELIDTGSTGQFFNLLSEINQLNASANPLTPGLYTIFFGVLENCTGAGFGIHSGKLDNYGNFFWDGSNLIGSGLVFDSLAVHTLLFSGGTTTQALEQTLHFGGISTTTLQDFCATNMPFDSSSIIGATLSAIPNGLCRVGTFLFVPTTDSLNQFADISSTTQTRFPFSYVHSVTSVWSALQASSTLNSPSFEYKLGDLGIGSTSALGNILPNFTVFSASTTKADFPAGTFDTLKALAGIAIVLTLIGDIFFSTRNMMKH